MSTVNFNQVILMGYVVGEPEFIRLKENFSMTEFTLEVPLPPNAPDNPNNTMRRRPEPERIKLRVYNKAAEAIKKYVREGQPMFIRGKVHCRNGVSQKTNKPYSIIDIECIDTQFLPWMDGGHRRQGPIERQDEQPSDPNMVPDAYLPGNGYTAPGGGYTPSAADFRGPSPAPVQPLKAQDADDDTPF